MKSVAMSKSIAMVALLLAVAVPSFAWTPVPEVDASSAASAIALVAGGIFLIRRRRNK